MGEVTQSLMQTAHHLDDLIENIRGLESIDDVYTAEKEDTILNGMYVGRDSTLMKLSLFSFNSTVCIIHVRTFSIANPFRHFILSMRMICSHAAFALTHVHQQPTNSEFETSGNSISTIPAESPNRMPRVSGNYVLDIHQQWRAAWPPLVHLSYARTFDLVRYKYYKCPCIGLRWIDAGKTPQDWFEDCKKTQQSKDDKHRTQNQEISQLQNVLCDAAAKLRTTV